MTSDSNEQFEWWELRENGEILTEYRRVRSRSSSNAFLRIDLEFAATFLPDWALLLLFLLRHTAMNGKPVTGEITLNARFWKLAGITSKDRRRKVLDHIENKVPPSVCQVRRGRGRCARLTLGADWP